MNCISNEFDYIDINSESFIAFPEKKKVEKVCPAIDVIVYCMCWNTAYLIIIFQASYLQKKYMRFQGLLAIYNNSRF